MRNKIYLYLFLFTLLILIFQFVNSSRILEAKEERISALETELQTEKNLSDSLTGANEGLRHFSLLENEYAISYFENDGFEAQEIANRVKNKIIDLNAADQNHPLVPFEGLKGSMRINKIKILNHRWLIADFTDGTYWGEVFVSYYVDENGEIDFEIEKSFLYPV